MISEVLKRIDNLRDEDNFYEDEDLIRKLVLLSSSVREALVSLPDEELENILQQIQITHEFLVGRIADYVSEEFKKFYLDNHRIIPKYEDSIRSKIPDMSDSRSDYLGIDQREIYIIGEAKTISYNLSSKSSVIQLRNYLKDGCSKITSI